MLINNRQIHIEIHSPEAKPQVVFLHHGLGSTRAWRGQVPSFVQAGYCLVIYDRWGYGRSETRPHLSVPSFADDLADLEAIIAAYNLKSFILIGHSDGGSIALSYAACFPERVQALVTVAAHIYLEPKMEPGIQAIKQAFNLDRRFRKGLERIHGEKFKATFNNWFDGWHNPASHDWDMRPLLPNISCPTLVIQGEEDEHATSQHAADIAGHIPGAELWLMPGAKHMLPQDFPVEFNHRVIGFLKSVVS